MLGGQSPDGSAIHSTDPATRLAHLDRLLDLFDAARFGGDDAARAALWEGLDNPPGARRGPAATRDAAMRLLEEATRIEDQFGEGLSESGRDFLNDAIMLLSVDASAPHDLESLETQALAFRSLLEVGHPRVVDNARWRLYDHARAVWTAAAQADPQRRIEIGLHGLLLEQGALEPWLRPAPIHQRPPLPDSAGLIDPALDLLSSLEADPRWAPVAQAVRTVDQAVRDAFVAVWPASRAALEAPMRPRGTGRREALAPVVALGPESLELAWGQPGVETLRRGDARLPARLDDLALRDGASRVLVVAPGEISASATWDWMQGAAKSGLAWIEFALREARSEGGGHVITQLPLRVVRSADRGPEAMALHEARLAVELSGRGARLGVDGAWVDAQPLGAAAFEARVAQMRAAYPGDDAIRVQLRPDLAWPQLLDGLSALLGPIDAPRFALAFVWGDGPALPADVPMPPRDPLAARLALLSAAGQAAWRVDKPFAFKAEDEAALVVMLEALEACRLEGEGAGREPLRFIVEMREGGASSMTVAGVAEDRRAAVEACAQRVASGFRLRHHLDAMRIEVSEAPSAK